MQGLGGCTRFLPLFFALTWVGSGSRIEAQQKEVPFTEVRNDGYRPITVLAQLTDARGLTPTAMLNDAFDVAIEAYESLREIAKGPDTPAQALATTGLLITLTDKSDVCTHVFEDRRLKYTYWATAKVSVEISTRCNRWETNIRRAVFQAGLLAITPDESQFWHRAGASVLDATHTGTEAPPERGSNLLNQIAEIYGQGRDAQARLIVEFFMTSRNPTGERWSLWQTLKNFLSRHGLSPSQALRRVLVESNIGQARRSPMDTRFANAHITRPLRPIETEIIDITRHAKEGELQIWFQGEYGTIWAVDIITYDHQGALLRQVQGRRSSKKGDRFYMPVDIHPDDAIFRIVVTNLGSGWSEDLHRASPHAARLTIKETRFEGD